MTAMRFLLVVVMTLAAIQIATAGGKNSSTNTKSSTTKGSFEVKDYGFGVETPTTMNAKGKGNALSPVGNTGKLGSKR
jgi:hypothetical protein